MENKLHKILCNRNKKRIIRNMSRKVEPIILTCPYCGKEVVVNQIEGFGMGPCPNCGM